MQIDYLHPPLLIGHLCSLVRGAVTDRDDTIHLGTKFQGLNHIGNCFSSLNAGIIAVTLIVLTSIAVSNQDFAVLL